MRHQEDHLLLRGSPHHVESIGGGDGQGLLAHHVQTPVQGGHGMLMVKTVRRGNHHRIQFVPRQKFMILGRDRYAEPLRHLLHLDRSLPTYSADLHIGAGTEHRKVILHRPPAHARSHPPAMVVCYRSPLRMLIRTGRIPPRSTVSGLPVSRSCGIQ